MSARDAADVASTLPMDHPLAQIARLRLDAHVRAERKTMKIKAPDPTFTGDVCGVAFVDGEGETSDRAAINYFQGAGYTVGGRTLNPLEDPAGPADPRHQPEQIQIGAPLRDAAQPRRRK